MKTSLSLSLLIQLFLTNIILLNAQTGISYFLPADTLMPNSKVLAISKTEDAGMMLLIMRSDSKYLTHSVQIFNIKNNGELQAQKNLELNNIYDLTAIEQKSNNEFSIFGNTTENKTFEPFQINVSKNCDKLSTIQLQQVYSTLISDVIKWQESFMILYSKVGKNNLYNISLHKVNAETGNVEWLKVISSENNEEADKIVAAQNGEFYVLGKKYNDDVTEFVPIIYKIDENGKQLWKKAIDVPANFNKQSIVSFSNNELIYVCGYTKNPTGFSETRVNKLSSTGEELASTSVKDFSANGILQISDESYLIYGSKFIVDQQQIVTKGKFVIINRQLSEIAERTLDKTDKPDVLTKAKNKTSSDFLCAQKLSNNKIAIGGKVFMPISTDLNNRFNVPLLMIINSDGTYEK